MAYLGRQESQEIASDHIRTSKPSSHVLSNHKLDSNKQRNRTISILCVGDSLTAGVTVMGHSELNKPYAPFLQGFLRKNHTNNDHSITVTHKGIPGWTSVDLIRGKRGLDNLTTILSRPRNRNIDILVIMAGSNDIFRKTFLNYNISSRVEQLHKLAYKQGVPHTIAVGIPGSAIHSMDANLSEQFTLLTKSLERFADSDRRATFAPFSFSFH